MLSQELYNKVLEYLEGDLSLTELRRWYGPNLFRWLKDPESSEAKIVSAIELVDSEVHDGIRTEEEARDYVRAALIEHGNIHEVLDNPDPGFETRSLNTTLYKDWKWAPRIHARSITVKQSP